MGNLRGKILPGHFHITSHKPLHVRVAGAAGGTGCELSAAESSSNQSQSLGNSSWGPEVVSKAALGRASMRAQVWVAHSCPVNKTGQFPHQCNMVTGPRPCDSHSHRHHTQSSQQKGRDKRTETQHGGKCIQSVIGFSPKVRCTCCF